MKQLTKEQAIAFHNNQYWEDMSLEERAKFQFCQERLCMPFDVFHEAIEKTLGRPVYTHEFARNREGIKAELFDGAEPPSMEDVFNMLPAEKTIVVCHEH